MTETELDNINGEDAEVVWIKKKEGAYLRKPFHCPICGSTDVTGDSLEMDSHTVWQKLYCSDCDAEWYDEYILSNVNIESFNSDYMLKELYPEGQKPDPNKAFKEEKK